MLPPKVIADGVLVNVSVDETGNLILGAELLSVSFGVLTVPKGPFRSRTTIQRFGGSRV